MQMLSWDPHDAEYPNFLMFAIGTSAPRNDFRRLPRRVHSGSRRGRVARGARRHP